MNNDKTPESPTNTYMLNCFAGLCHVTNRPNIMAHWTLIGLARRRQSARAHQMRLMYQILQPIPESINNCIALYWLVLWLGNMCAHLNWNLKTKLYELTSSRLCMTHFYIRLWHNLKHYSLWHNSRNCYIQFTHIFYLTHYHWLSDEMNNCVKTQSNNPHKVYVGELWCT